MTKKGYRNLLWGISVFGVLCFIFKNSLMLASASSEESGSFFELLRSVFPSITHHTVRKLAHLSEYALLGAHFALIPYLWKTPTRITLPVMLLFGTLVGVLDEGIQRFVPGRGASLADVALDSFGYLVGLVLVFALLRLRKERRHA